MAVGRRTVSGFGRGVARGARRAAPGAGRRRRTSPSSCIMRSRRCRACTRQFSGAVGAQGRGRVGRPHPHRHLSLDAARRQPAELFDQARDGIVDIVWAMPSKTPGRFPKIELFELPFVPSRRALVSSKALEDFAARTLMDEFREIHPICFVVRRSRHRCMPIVRSALVADVKGLRLDVQTRFTADAVALLGARPCRCRAGSCRSRSCATWSTAALFPGTWCRRSSSTICSKRTPISPMMSLSTTTSVLAMNKTSYERLPADLKKVIDDNSGQVAAGMAGTMWDLQAKAVADVVESEAAIRSSRSCRKRSRIGARPPSR